MDDATKPVAEPRTVDAGRALVWWTDAWAMFMRNPVGWVLLGLVLLVVFIVLSFIPLVGGLVASLIAPVFAGSWMLAARKAEAGGSVEVGDLFASFKDKPGPLVVLGALLLAGTVVIVVVAGVLGLGAAMGVAAGSGRHGAAGMMAAMGAGLLALLVALALGTLVAMALWFAPALVVLRGVAPVEAAKASFSASLKNILPFLVHGVIYLVAAIVASIPFGLGWIVLAPVSLLTVYLSYKDVFGS